MRTCDICQKTFPNKNNLRQHRRNVHKLPPYYRPMECDKCGFITLSVALIDEHFQKKHGSKLEKMCIYCGIGFDKCQNFYKHLDEKHQLPPPVDPVREQTKPTKSCLSGGLKVFTITGSS